jgi:hypothetical protein
MGRTNNEVELVGTLIANGPSQSQSVWKSAVCVAYRAGKPIAECVRMADAAVVVDGPEFVPVYDPALLDV